MDGSSYRNWTFIPDRPTDEDLLWQDDNIQAKLEHIAERIVSPLYLDASDHPFQISSSMTFAINGYWGMGKSSALKMLKKKVLAIAEREEVKQQLKICEYIASAHAPFAMDARITLAQRIFIALSGSGSRAIQQLGEQINSYKDDILVPGQDKHVIARDSYILQNITTNLSRLTDFAQILQERMQGEDGKAYVLLVLIDDLDRCNNNFIWQILNFIQQLSDVPNIFFVLSIEEDHLKSAIEKFSRWDTAPRDQKNANVDFASDKYVQHAIIVPAMSETSLPNFIRTLMPVAGEATKETDYVALAIIENISLFLMVLNVKRGEQPLSPRLVKRFLNSVRSELANRMQQADTQEKRLKVVKEEMLKFTWTRFYEDCFLPTLSERNTQSRDAFGLLEAICLDFRLGEIRSGEDLLTQLKRLLKEPFDLQGYNQGTSPNLELVKYLGMEPYWFMEQSSTASIYQNNRIPLDTGKELSKGSF
jgi:hypothetical protein